MFEILTETVVEVYEYLALLWISGEETTTGVGGVTLKSRWRNQARVTTRSVSRMGPKTVFVANTTTAFWMVERVTSGGRLMRSEESICLVQDMPKRVVFERGRVKYVWSSWFWRL